MIKSSKQGNVRAVRRAAGLAMAITAIAVFGAIVSHEIAWESPVLAASVPSYSAEIAPIFQKNCLSCHNSVQHKSGLIMESYSALLKGGKHGQSFLPHNAKGSLMVQMLEGDVDPQMPADADPLPAAQISLIKAWIDAGGEGPAETEVAPPLATPSTPNIQPEVAVVSPVTAVRFSPDGKLLAVGGQREVRIFEPASGKLLTTLTGHAGLVRSLAFSPDGKQLAAAGGLAHIGGEIKIWDVLSHQLLQTMQGHKDCIYSVAWSRDGKLIASGSYDRLVKLWDAATGKESKTLQDHIDAVFAVAFSPDGKHLASASQDRTVKIWEISSGKRLYTLSDALDGLTGLAYSPSGDQVAAAGYDKTIYVWGLQAAEGHLMESLIADEDSLLALVWSPDGKTIVTSSADGAINFRNPKLQLIEAIDHQPDWVDALDISSDGRWLAAGRYNGTLSLYDTATYKEPTAQITAFDSHLPQVRTEAQQAASR